MTWKIEEADCIGWLGEADTESFHAIITDPPYGLKEYTPAELQKMKKGVGGVWRIPPRIGGTTRKPLPRFTVLTPTELEELRSFFTRFGEAALRVLRPGGHVFMASNPLLVHHVALALNQAGFEQRGIVVRLVRTLKGGFRPKLAEEDFKDVSSIPRSCWEPWVVVRKPFSGRLSENLRKWQTGGLRRDPEGNPFTDVIPSLRTPENEREIAPHPSLKPQAFLRRLVWASLPLGVGRVLDPFCGSGSTLAAAEALGFDSVGLEINSEYASLARKSVPRLSKLNVPIWVKADSNGNDVWITKPGQTKLGNELFAELSPAL